MWSLAHVLQLRNIWQVLKYLCLTCMMHEIKTQWEIHVLTVYGQREYQCRRSFIVTYKYPTIFFMLLKDFFSNKSNMLLDVHKISLIYDFWKFNNEETYLHDATELSRKLTESDTIDGKFNCCIWEKISYECFCLV